VSAPRPPALWRWLIGAVVPASDRRFLLADLEEGFETRTTRDGLPAARRWYRRQVLGSVPACLQTRRRTRRGLRPADLLDDARFALRSLAKSPMVALVSVASLAFGLAAATTVFSVANAFLLRPASPAVQEPERLVSLFKSEADGGIYGALSYPDYLDLVEQAHSFESAASHRLGIVRLGRVDEGRNILVEIVDGDYFDVLGVDMVVGRRFTADETLRGAAARVTVIGERLWESRFDRDPRIIGGEILLEGQPHTIIGVAPRSLIGRFLALRVDAWVPIGIPGGTFRSTERELSSRTEQNYGVVARLRDGVSREEAAAEVELIAERLQAEYEEAWLDARGRPKQLTVMGESATRARPDMVAALGTASSVVLLAAVLLLAIACANVAGVLLARADQRQGEIAVRRALGAGRGRLVVMLLTESLLLGLTAGGLGILLTSWALHSVDSVALPIGDVSLEFDLIVDGRVLIFGVVLAIFTSILFGLAPALRASRAGVTDALRNGANRGATRVSRLRRLLIVGQVAAALIFVVGSAMALDSFRELSAVNWGVDPAGVAVMSHRPPDDMAEGDLPAHYRDLVARMEARPEVDRAVIGTAVEGSALIFDASAAIEVPGREPVEGEDLRVNTNAVSPGYFETLGIGIARGRTFTDGDDGAAPAVAIVNESLARRLWPETSALGQRLAVHRGSHELEAQIVGVAADARYLGFESSGADLLWMPIAQVPTPTYTLLLKGRGPAETLLPILRGEIDPSDPEIQLITPRTYTDLINYQFAFIRLLGQALAGAAIFGLLLATLGIYGVVSFVVSRRTHEMAIRSALGALPGQVIRLVVSDGLRLAGWGMAIGMVVVVPLSIMLRSVVGDIPPLDLSSVVLGAAILLAAALVAALVPARRANAIDPATALRDE
jgi:putative ABC transport system permease protein